MLKEIINKNIPKIEFIDLQAQRRVLSDNISSAIERVLLHGVYILGPEVSMLEEQLKSYTNATDVITCSNGTDALRLLLLNYQVGPGDAIFVPTFTFASTAEVIALANATPIFVDICPDTFNMDPHSLEKAIAKIDRKKLNPKGIIAVDLFGLPANYYDILKIAKENNLWVIADAAQSFGGAIQNQKVGTLTTTTAASFFPSKPLACYGDGGAVFTTDPQIGQTIRSLRNHGCGKDRYDHIHIGLNSRLDSIQAAILIEKLRVFPQELKRRNDIAAFYTETLQNYIGIPHLPRNYSSAWGLYTVTCEKEKREILHHFLLENDIPTNIYYRKPLHLQPAYQSFPRADERLQVAEKVCHEVLSLPMHPYLTDSQIEYIVDCLRRF